jgi:hypothetical protein
MYTHFWSRNFKISNFVGNLDIKRRLISKYNLEKYEVRVSAGLNYLKVQKWTLCIKYRVPSAQNFYVVVFFGVCVCVCVCVCVLTYNMRILPK